MHAIQKIHQQFYIKKFMWNHINPKHLKKIDLLFNVTFWIQICVVLACIDKSIQFSHVTIEIRIHDKANWKRFPHVYNQFLHILKPFSHEIVIQKDGVWNLKLFYLN